MWTITIRESNYGPPQERFYAFWGDDFDYVDVYGTGPDKEAAVRDLLDNFDIPA